MGTGNQHPVLVCGSGRSGTTWLQELLGSNDFYRVLFEPFCKMNPAFKGAERLYVQPDGQPKKPEEYSKILLGEFQDNEWTNKLGIGNPSSDKLLIKEIRLNLMLGWVQKQSPMLKIIYIVRDPFSASFSLAENKFGANLKSTYLSQTLLVKELLGKERAQLLHSADTFYQEKIGTWAIENYAVLKNVERNQNITSVYYETLVEYPDVELARLYEFCGLDGALVHNMDFRKKSSLSTRKSITKPSSRKFGKRWKGKISSADESYAKEVLDAFNLSQLYSARNKPAFDQPLEVIL